MNTTCNNLVSIKSSNELIKVNNLFNVRYNTHVRDYLISFDEPSHVYSIIGLTDDLQQMLVSVTSFIDSMFPSFPTQEAIIKMKNGRNWNSDNKYWGMSDSDIALDWDRIKKEAATLGTKMHNFLESYFNFIINLYNTYGSSKEYYDKFLCPNMILKEEYWPVLDSSDIIYKEHFYEFLNEHKHFRPYRMEWRMFCIDNLWAGTADALFEDIRFPFNKTGELHLIDWKRVKKLQMYNNFQSGLPNTPVSNLDDCNYNHHVLQLNMYKYLLETYYSVKVKSMSTVIFNPNVGYKKCNIPDVSNIIDQFISLRQDQIFDVLSSKISTL